MSPRELALRLLRQRFAPATADRTALEGLAAFQREAVARLEQMLERYGGALLADSVGLGKTFVGAALVRRAVRRGEAAGVIVPSTLLRQWRRALRGVERVSFRTHAQLSRGTATLPMSTTLIVVDEAHAFRNPQTYRYAALARITAGRRIVLVTATPVNNSLRDLYWLLRLFATDDAFTPVGAADLPSCFRDAERNGGSAQLAAVLAAVVVRRSRGDVVRQGAMGALRFPDREPPVEVPYPVAAGQQALLSAIAGLELAPWTAAAGDARALLLRIVLLKRLDSSRAALFASLRRVRLVLGRFADALAHGLLLSPAAQRVPMDADQLELDALVLEPLPQAMDTDALRHSALRDLTTLDGAIGVASGGDPKLRRLERLLQEDLAGRPVLLFTEYRDTAVALWRALRDQLPTALIHGTGAWLGRAAAPRRIVVERFAPLSNGLPPPPARERPRLLIATDVLAEGLNLQDAADLVSYDLPWNPVRLLQRLGRIDRLGSTHTTVRSYYFAPDAELEAMLRLLRRLQAKLAAVRGSIGEEARVLEERAAPRGTAGRTQPLVRPHAAVDAALRLEERLRTALRQAEDSAVDPLAGLPLAWPTAPGPAGPPVGEEAAAAILDLAAPCDPPRPGTVCVLFFDVDGRQRAVRVGRDVREDAALGAHSLLAALGQSGPAPALPARGAARLVRRAERLLSASADPPPRPDHARELRRRLLRLLQHRPGGPTAAECARAERIAARLLGRPSLPLELALRRVRPSGDFEALVGALERALDGAGSGGSASLSAAPAAAVGGPRFLGGFRLRPG